MDHIKQITARNEELFYFYNLLKWKLRISVAPRNKNNIGIL